MVKVNIHLKIFYQGIITHCSEKICIGTEERRNDLKYSLKEGVVTGCRGDCNRRMDT